ncbi:ribosomal L25p protein [Nitzschia inconspicua]|uniref:Ribosomal L25p protein n=1 Tax=Nitzschia inconspicua TaxID=303405 RepID=A0A9K3Q4V5_9STRA|nr:ribosomal L25p protein [Nitzschia inconspicua]
MSLPVASLVQRRLASLVTPGLGSKKVSGRRSFFLGSCLARSTASKTAVTSTKIVSPNVVVLQSSWFSTTRLEDPGKLVSGLTLERIEEDPTIAEFVRANFQQQQQSTNDETSNGIVIPPEILREFGIVDDDTDTEDDDEKKKKRYGDPRIDAGLGTEEQQRLNIRVLKTYVRNQEGSKRSHRLRMDHAMIPGLLYGGDPTRGITSLQQSSKLLVQTPWSELQRELDRFHRRFESRVYDLTVYHHDDDYNDNDDDDTATEVTVHRVIPRNVQRHPVQGKIYCANFLRYHAGRPIQIPFQYINKEESPALKRDGFIVPVRKSLECFVEDGVPIPDFLEVECTGLVLKDIIRMDRVIFPDGVRPTKRVDVANFIVGPVQGGRSAATAEDDQEGDASSTTGDD